MSFAKVRTWPSLDVTVGTMPPPPPKESDPYPWRFHRDAYWNGCRHEYFTEIEDLRPPHERSPHMGLSDVLNSHSRPEPNRKPNNKGLTTYAKRAVKSGVALLFRDQGRKNLTFFTGTLAPRSCAEEVEANQQFYEVVRQFNQMVTRRLRSHGIEPLYVGVVEIQEKRFKDKGQLALHYHMLYPGKAADGSWVVGKGEAQQLWAKAVSNATGRQEGFQGWTRVEKPKRSLKQELGKYMSKGNQIVREVKEAGRADELPKQWWSMARALVNQVKAEVVELTDDDASLFLRHLDTLQNSGAVNLRPCMTEVPDHRTGESFEILTGYVGWWNSVKHLKRFLASLPNRKENKLLITDKLLSDSG